MPFFEQLVPGGPWVRKRDVGLRQLAPRDPVAAAALAHEVAAAYAALGDAFAADRRSVETWLSKHAP